MAIFLLHLEVAHISFATCWKEERSNSQLTAAHFIFSNQTGLFPQSFPYFMHAGTSLYLASSSLF